MDSSAEPTPASVADLAALGRLIDQHRPVLLSMLQRRIDRGLQGRIDAEDVFQEACIVASRRWSDFQRHPGADGYVWLYGLVRDQLFTHWRNHTRGPRDLRRDEHWPDRSSEQLGQGFFAHGAGPRTEAERRELRERTAKVIELLSDNDYEIIKLRHFDQLSFKQAGQLLEVSENAAAVRYARALKRLRTIWDAIYGDDP